MLASCFREIIKVRKKKCLEFWVANSQRSNYIDIIDEAEAKAKSSGPTSHGGNGGHPKRFTLSD